MMDAQDRQRAAQLQARENQIKTRMNAMQDTVIKNEKEQQLQENKRLVQKMIE